MTPLTFLLADDDADDTLLICDAFHEIDPEIDCPIARDGEHVLRMLATKQPDLILLDINMPIMDGWECLAQIRQQEPGRDIPVLMYSTSSVNAHIGKALALGATGFIIKPDSYIEIQRICFDIYTVVRERAWHKIPEIKGIITSEAI